MAIDLAGPRFYTQQLASSRGGTNKAPARLKKDIVLDIEAVIGISLTSLMKLTKPDLEVLYDKISLYKG